MHTLFDCSGRTAIITGASRGLGAAAAQALAGAGANVALVGRDLAALEEQAALAEAHGAGAMTIVCDMGRHEEIPAAVAKARARFGTIDILVNNAGIIRRSPAEQYSLEDWNDVIGVNTTAAFLMAQEAGREMIARGYGRIINIASLLSFSGGLNVVAYTASKSAIAGVTRALANEWGRHGVNVNAIAPGYFHTDATAALQRNTERYNALLARIPAGRWGDPEDLQGAIVFLASAASNYVNGHILAVDGGWMAA
ncbi:MAG TPA: SDR family oxidoreductase [Candidatus Kapabacteria bacterium]|nr:SDR family oxidoreductase [Candidatus Kapabacteria bacterium]